MKKSACVLLAVIGVVFLMAFYPELPKSFNDSKLYVGRWKLKRKQTITTKNQCYVDALSLEADGTFSITFNTVINNDLARYTFVGDFNTLDQGEKIRLGDGLAYLSNITLDKEQLAFKFEYGENLGMFCTRKHQPFDHSHLPHDLLASTMP